MIPLLLLTTALAADFPDAKIANGKISMRVMLPDAKNGSYQGTRFDWSGIIASLKYENHEFFGQWYAKHDPKIHDAITGPVEEYLSNDAGLGYSDAQVGEPFLRIGVGAVKKPEEKAYRRFATYEIVDPGKRELHQGKNWIAFDQSASVPSGYAYAYKKTLRVKNNRVIIEHQLKNTGTRAIDTLVYNHNFFVIDDEVVGPDIAVRFAFDPKPDKPFANGGEIRERAVAYQKDLQPGQTVAADLSGFSENARDYDVRIENRKTGAGVHITGDRPLAKMYFWSIKTVACPEPYIRIQAAKGQEVKWRIVYEFYTIPGK
jgi:hypothetical protein